MGFGKGAALAACLVALVAGCVSDPAGDEPSLEVSVEEITCGRTTCRLPNATARCARGRCAIASCFTYRGDCNHVDADGCEVNLGADVRNCGGCGVTCPARANATAACAQGVCGFTCNAGYADCDGDPRNGCEVNVGSDRAHCGGCGRQCGSPGDALAACCSGVCTALVYDVRNCGGCGVTCPSGPHGTPVCDYPGTCRLQCEHPYYDCDGDGSNGCEVNLFSGDPNNCGGCGLTCEAGAVCQGGGCVCPPGQFYCYDPEAGHHRCFDMSSDVNNCGGCGIVCEPGGACSGGRCTCADGRADCYGTCVDLRTDLYNCGACGVTCGPGSACVDGACVGGCPPGYADCDGDSLCEANLQSDPNNCGVCYVACPGGTRCRAGTCSAT